MLELGFNNQTGNRQYDRRFFETILRACVKKLNLEGKDMGVSLNLVENRRIKELNKKYRGLDKATDVLSFPLQSKLFGAKSAKNAILELGDIFISPSVAGQKARKEKKKIRAEMAFLTVHGFLHLCGYEHERSKKDAEKMFRLQNRILNTFTNL